MRIIISAGGTGGHIIPALAVAKELQKKNADILYIGNAGSMEEKLVKESGISFKAISVQKIYRKFTLAHFMFPYHLIKSIRAVTKIFKEFNPDLCLGTGGFVCGPVGIVSILKGIPLFLQEQNSFPGITTRVLGKFAKIIFLGNEKASGFFGHSKIIVTGNPINSTVVEEKELMDFSPYGFAPSHKKLLIIGGSQGSLFINNLIEKNLNALRQLGFDIIWQVGKSNIKYYKDRYNGVKGLYLFDFSKDMGKIYNASDIAISRAGALTLAELECKQIPSIIIPLPSAAANHQYFNAMEMVGKGVALVLEQKKANSVNLLSTMEKMLSKYELFKSKFFFCKHTDAASSITNYLISYKKKLR